MKQYNRIMLGEHGMYVQNCLTNNYIGTGFLRNQDLSSTPYHDKDEWRRYIIDLYLKVLNAKPEYLDDVKGGLMRFCDKGFSSDDEVLAYCNENHIPC